MRPSRERQVVATAVRCYPARWRLRHGDEAVLLASALLEDGVSWWSIASNFIGGATRERFLRKPSLRVGTTLAAITMSIVTVPLVLFASLAPASASSVNVVIAISNPNSATRQLESAFISHHFKFTLSERTVPTRLVGSILSVNTVGASSTNATVIRELHGVCVDGSSGCVDGLVLPFHFSGIVHVTIGRAVRLSNGRGR